MRVRIIGGDVLQLSEDFLAMDWQNDPKHAHHVKISQKEVLVSNDKINTIVSLFIHPLLKKMLFCKFVCTLLKKMLFC